MMAQKQVQTQKQKILQRQSLIQMQLQQELQLQTPELLQQLEEEDVKDETQDNENDDVYSTDDAIQDESPEYEDMSGDEEYEESEEDIESGEVVFRHYPVAEINIIGGEFVVSRQKLKNKKSGDLLSAALELIISHNAKFIQRETNEVEKIRQSRLVEMTGEKKGGISKYISKNYIALPDGQIYCLSYFFSHDAGRPSSVKQEHLDFITKLIQEEESRVRETLAAGLTITPEMLCNDTYLTAEFEKQFGKTSRKAIARIRESLDIPSFEIRKNKYITDFAM